MIIITQNNLIRKRMLHHSKKKPKTHPNNKNILSMEFFKNFLKLILTHYKHRKYWHFLGFCIGYSKITSDGFTIHRTTCPIRISVIKNQELWADKTIQCSTIYLRCDIEQFYESHPYKYYPKIEEDPKDPFPITFPFLL